MARPRTRKKPHMSVTVVSTGPEATAGSAPKRRSSRGTVPPIDTATSVFQRQRRGHHRRQPEAAFPRPRRGTEQDAQCQAVEESHLGFLPPHARRVAGARDAEGEFAHADGSR